MTQETRLEPDANPKIVPPKPEAAKVLLSYWNCRLAFGLNGGLAAALQCKARGWHDLAEQLWTASIKESTGYHLGAHFQPPDLPKRTAVAYLAWAHYANELAKPNTDRVKIAKQIRHILATEPRLNTPDNRAFLGSLEAAIIPIKAKPDSVERMIDDLTDVCNLSLREKESDPRVSRLMHAGFSAVPALIEHLDDERLTRSVRWGGSDKLTWHIRVKHLVSNVLKALIGEDLGEDWLRRNPARTVNKGDARAWWDKARKVGEEAYCLSLVLPKSDKDIPLPVMLEILATRISPPSPQDIQDYPERASEDGKLGRCRGNTEKFTAGRTRNWSCSFSPLIRGCGTPFQLSNKC